MQDQLLIDISHPVLRDHQVHGRHVLPGLGYVDLLHQIFREHGHDSAELALENLSIYRPLVVNEDQEILLDIDWQPFGAEAWRIAVHGRLRQPNGADGKRIQYVTAEMRRRGRIAFDETIDLAAIRQTSRSAVDAEEIYRACRSQGLVHAGLMKTEGTAYLTDSAIYVELSLGAEGLESAEALMFHPALIDGSAVVAGGVLARASAGPAALSVPLFYESFQASALIQRRCWTRVALSSVRERNQLTYLTLELFNDFGRKIAELRDLGCREIREAELITLDVSPARPVTADVSSAAPDGDAEQFLRRLLSARLGTPAERMPSDRSFAEMGLASADLLDLGRLIGEWAGEHLSPAFLFEHTTIAEVSRFLAGRTAAAPSPVTPTPRVRAPRSAGSEGVAIVGISGRFPGAADTKELWDRLATGSDCITEVPAARWDHALYFDPSADAPGKTRCKWGGFIEGVDEFDPLFFSISPREAELMDPQGRLFLQTVWNLLEGSGHSRDTLQAEYAGKVGVYVGSMYQHYTAPDSDALGQGLTSLSSYSAIANRVSHFFGLLGPSIAVDTMCSSAMTAVHMACKDLLLGECELAIAGGVNLSIHPKKYLGLSAAQLIGSHAGSRSFSRGDGYLPAETVGAVLLKPLSRALADGDAILGVIRSSAVNHGGRANGYTVPNPKAQAQLIAEVLSKADVDARTISYVEAAANGSASGDLIELAALTSAFGRSTSDRQFCAIGSVKSSIGHAEAASGISQLAKVIGQLQHGQLAPASKAAVPSAELQWEQTPFYLQHDLQEWKRPVVSEDGQLRELPRRAIINSFGAGGAYASLLLEEHPAAAEQASVTDDRPQVVILSAKNAERLGAVILQLVAHLEAQENVLLADLAFTLQTRREAMESRLALVVRDREELVRGLLSYLGASAPDESLVPTFAGEVDDAQPAAVGLELDRALAMNDLRGLAALWTQGVDVPWHLLHQTGARRVIALPTYPFRRDRYWLPIAAAPLPFTASAIEDDELELIAGGSAGDRIRQFLTRFLSQSMRIPAAEIHTGRSLDAYGFDSIIAMRLLRAIERRMGVRVSGRALLEHRTIDALAVHVEMLLGDGSLVAEAEAATPVAEDSSDLAIQLLERYKLGQLSREDLEALIDQGAIA